MTRECIECGSGIVPGTDQDVEHCWNCLNEMNTPKGLRKQRDQLLIEVQVHAEMSARYRLSGALDKAEEQCALAQKKLSRVDELDSQRERMIAPTQQIAAE